MFSIINEHPNQDSLVDLDDITMVTLKQLLCFAHMDWKIIFLNFHFSPVYICFSGQFFF